MGMPEPVPLPAETVGQLVRGIDLEGPIVDHARKGIVSSSWAGTPWTG
jgi:hypothetical protein